MRTFFIGLAAMSAALTMAVAPAQAVPATPCDSALASTTVGPLVVPAGATCTLTDVVVDGNIRIMAGGALLTHGSTLQGNVMGNGARTVQLINTDVVGNGTTGNIDLSGTQESIIIGSDGCAVDPATGNNINLFGNDGPIAICYMTVGESINLKNNHDRIGVFHNTIGNPLIVQNNDAPFVRLRDNEVGVTGGGSMIVQNNITTGNAKSTNGLRIKRNYSHNRLNCVGNVAAPIGKGNTADNGMSGQCVGL